VAEHPCTVSEITRAIRQTLELEFPPLWVVGELAEYRQHTSGHRYFTLKDESCQIRCVMWRSQKLSGFRPEVGMEVLARGQVTVYERGGQYQLTVSQLFQAGMGQQQLALEVLKQRLLEEGLFEASARRPMPPYPETIGVVTSQTGAAIRDILQVLGRRFPGVRVVLRPALVQGEGAAEDIARGIEELNACGGMDLLIVGRGGGSPEDLAAFNTEVVVRAVRGSDAPVISAVGHEVDVSLADLAADCRAPTPSAAAELAVRDRGELEERVARLAGRAYDALRRLLEENAELLDTYRDSYGLRRVEELVFQHLQRIDETQKDLYTGIERRFEGKAEAYRLLTAQLGTLSPLSVLSRGYSLTQRLEDGAVVIDAGTLVEGERVRVRFAKGEAVCSVDEVYSL
jgi:exodeoxyribonuclease VII large subunit